MAHLEFIARHQERDRVLRRRNQHSLPLPRFVSHRKYRKMISPLPTRSLLNDQASTAEGCPYRCHRGTWMAWAASQRGHLYPQGLTLHSATARQPLCYLEDQEAWTTHGLAQTYTTLPSPSRRQTLLQL